MKTTDTLRAMWMRRLKEMRAEGYDPYNSIGSLKLGTISISWR